MPQIYNEFLGRLPAMGSNLNIKLRGGAGAPTAAPSMAPLVARKDEPLRKRKPRTDRDPDELLKTSDVGGKRFLALVLIIIVISVYKYHTYILTYCVTTYMNAYIHTDRHTYDDVI